MNDLIEGILRYSQAGQQQMTVEAFDSSEIVHEVIDGLSTGNGQTIQAIGPFPIVDYDRTHLAQVLQNLIDNAIKHKGETEGNVAVGCNSTDGEWTFQVTDEGPGIRKNTTSEFSRYFKLSSRATKSKQQELGYHSLNVLSNGTVAL